MSAPSSTQPARVFLGVSGASGALYGVRTLQMLVEAGVEVSLVYSKAARRVLWEECDLSLGDDPAVLLPPGLSGTVRLYPEADVGAPPASGTALGDAVLIVPCSLSTLARITSGRADTLIERAAQVALKEQKRLVVVPRETPLSRLHLDNMSRLAWAGATVLPAMPGFYHRPESIQDLVDHVCAKILHVCGIPQSRVRAWDGGKGAGGAEE